VNGTDCSEFVVNGTSASNGGYPEVDVQYTMKICNYNDFAMTFAPDFTSGNNAYEPRSYLDFWYTIPVNEVRTKIFYKSTRKYNSKATISSLAPGECVGGRGEEKLDTSTAQHYMKALVNGAREDGYQAGFCNAYAFNPIDFKYDYDDGPCDVSVSDATNKETASDPCYEVVTNIMLSILLIDWGIVCCERHRFFVR